MDQRSANNSPSGSSVTFRAARPEEDELLARIFCNAFLPVWDHNWYHSASEPLEPVVTWPASGDGKENASANSTPPPRPLSRQQKVRVRFYKAVVSQTRLLGGEVLVAEVPASASFSNNDETRERETEPGRDRDIGAVLLWLPPDKRMGDFDVALLWNAGFISLILPWNYGLTGLYRLTVGHGATVQSMFARSLPDLPPRGYKEVECGFVNMIASNPKHAGKGYASKLLQHQIDRHFARFPNTPVILDTTTSRAERAYERLGFRVLAAVPVDTGTDAVGFPLTSSASQEVKRLAKETCVIRIMAKLP